MQIPLRLLHAIARTRYVKVIYAGGKIPYLERYFLGRRNGYTYYLHRYLGPDPERDLHNHPWKFAYSIMLHGSYIERRLEFGFQKRKIEYIPSNVINIVRGFYYYNAVSARNKLGENTWHAIVEITEPETWTLFWHSAWMRPWGFLTEQGYKVASDRTDVKEEDMWWNSVDRKKGKETMYVRLG